MLSVIMPAFNEASCIENSIKETVNTIKAFYSDFELIIVDDGSTDNTFDIATKVSKKFENVSVIKTPKNVGKGHAIRHGFNFVSGDLVTFLDADLDLSPKAIETLLKYMNSSQADIVIGSKNHPDSKINYPKSRKALSYFYHLFTKALFNLPVSDTQVGIKLFKKKVLDDIFPRLLVKGYAFDLELLVNALNRHYKIVEAPIVLDFKRSFGRISLKDIKNIFIDTLAIFYRLKILHYYDKEIKK